MKLKWHLHTIICLPKTKHFACNYFNFIVYYLWQLKKFSLNFLKRVHKIIDGIKGLPPKIILANYLRRNARILVLKKGLFLQMHEYVNLVNFCKLHKQEKFLSLVSSNFWSYLFRNLGKLFPLDNFSCQRQHCPLVDIWRCVFFYFVLVGTTLGRHHWHLVGAGFTYVRVW